jgi:beta-glucosidase
MTLCALACSAALTGPAAHAQANPALLGDKTAFIDDLLRQMTLEEKIGQLRLISIGPEMPAKKLAEELAAGRVGGTFNSVTRPENRPLQDGAMRSRLKIPMFFAYDVIHGHRTTFPIGWAWPPAGTWTVARPCASPPRKLRPTAST